MVPQKFSYNKLKNLRGVPIFHRGDLKKCLGQLQGNFSVVFYHAKGGSEGSEGSPPPPPKQVHGIEGTVGGLVGEAPGRS